MSTKTRILYPILAAMLLSPAVPFTSHALESDVITLVSTGAVWRLHDRGADLGTNWKFSGTDDSAWNLGFGEFGYGDGDETTVADFGPDANNKYITTYFRHDFLVPTPSVFSNIRLRVKRDDGIVVYLNGTQVHRSNLTAGQNHLTLASLAADDGSGYLTVNFNPSMLLPGENIIAAEVHQAASDDPDLSFDLGLVGIYLTNSPLLAATSLNASQFVVSWPIPTSSSFVLQSSSQLNATNWISVSNPVVSAAGRYHVTNIIAGSGQFFRLFVAPQNLIPCQPPIPLAQPLAVFADIGTNITLSVVATGTPTIVYQWFHNTFPVPGATNSDLTLTNVQREDGGCYELCLAGPCDIGFSYPIAVTIGGTNVEMTDLFAARPTFSDYSGQINSSNQLASAEPGEPAMLGHPAERSMWLSFIAPDDGVLTIDTTGSTFDTLLAAYHGSSVAALDLIDADDDHGPAYTSKISFAVTFGEQVEVKVDNYPGHAGAFQLNWNLVVTNEVVPLILVQPISQVVPLGSNFTVSVTATNPGSFVPLTYQWRLNGSNVFGATAPSLTVTNIQAADTGSYDVLVSNGFFSTTSQTANVRSSVGTGQLITVASGAKRRKCGIYYYVGSYKNPDDLNGYFQVNEPVQLLTWTGSNQTTQTVKYNAWAYRFSPLFAGCTFVRTPIDPSPSSVGPYSYFFEVLVPSINTTFYVDHQY